jgi:hypothetical protein
MLTAEPVEGGPETATPPPTPKATLREMGPAGVGSPNPVGDKASIIQAALSRAQSGERKITSDSKQIGERSPQELIGINFDNLPEDFVEITSVLPTGYKAFEDLSPTWSDGTPEYYIYFEKTYQWYGPF